MKYLRAFLVLWLLASVWVAFRPRESNPLPVLPWAEVKPTLSFSGRWLAFDSDPAAEGVFGRGPGRDWEVVVCDRDSGQVKTLSEPGVSFRGPRLSGSGEKIVFEASPGPDFLSDVCLADTETLTYQRLSTPWSRGGRGSAFAPNISSSGDVLSFLTYRPNSPSGRHWEPAVALGGAESITTPFPEKVGIVSSLVALSPNGRRAAWESRQVTGDKGGFWNRLLVSDNGKSALTLDDPAWEPSLSSNECAYVGPDEQGTYQIMLHDFSSGTTKVLTSGNDDSFEPCLSEDGRRLVFTSYADDLVEGDRNAASDIFYLDLESSELLCVSKDGDGNSYNPTLSGDGSTVAFSSLATNLGQEEVPRGQIYLWERGWASCRVAPKGPE